MEIPPAGQVRPGVGTLVIKCLSGHGDKVTQWASALHLPTKFYKVLGHPLSYEAPTYKALNPAILGDGCSHTPLRGYTQAHKGKPFVYNPTILHTLVFLGGQIPTCAK